MKKVNYVKHVMMVAVMSSALTLSGCVIYADDDSGRASAGVGVGFVAPYHHYDHHHKHYKHHKHHKKDHAKKVTKKTTASASGEVVKETTTTTKIYRK